MRTARLEYASGREVLRDLWGYLWAGGLVLAERAAATLPAGCTDGDAVLLDVRITSLRKEYRVPGRIHRRDDGRTVVAFDERPQDLLYAVWADGQGVPERRHRRYDLDLPARVSARGQVHVGRVLNVSRGGMCLRAAAPLPGGERIAVHLDGEGDGSPLIVWGRVRWTSGRSGVCGVEFESFQEELVVRLLRHAAGHAPPARPAPL